VQAWLVCFLRQSLSINCAMSVYTLCPNKSIPGHRVHLTVGYPSFRVAKLTWKSLKKYPLFQDVEQFGFQRLSRPLLKVLEFDARRLSPWILVVHNHIEYYLMSCGNWITGFCLEKVPEISWIFSTAFWLPCWLSWWCYNALIMSSIMLQCLLTWWRVKHYKFYISW